VGSSGFPTFNPKTDRQALDPTEQKGISLACKVACYYIIPLSEEVVSTQLTCVQRVRLVCTTDPDLAEPPKCSR
jgi:hypothetical protein